MRKNEKYICDQLAISKPTTEEDFPLYIQIETTAKCNSKCRMCPRSKELPKRRGWYMEPALRGQLIEELSNHTDHIRRVIPQGYGEPLLDPELHSFISNLKKIGIKEVFISSNASALNREKSIALLESGLDQIDLSVDAFTKETYEKIRRGLKFEVVIKNIKQFIKLRNESRAKTRIRFRYVIQEDNHQEFAKFSSYWRELLTDEDIISGKKIHTFGGNIEMPGSKDYLELHKKLLSLPCKGLFGSLFILCDGSVPICGVDVNQKQIAGDANISSLQSIWNGNLFKEFRKKHLEYGRASFSFCSECNSWAPELKLKNA